MTYEQFETELGNLHYAFRQMSRLGHDGALDEIQANIYALKEAHPEYEARLDAEAEELSYEQFKERITELAAEVEQLSVQDYQQWNAAKAANAMDALMLAYPEHHARFAAELCATESREREWEF